MNTTGLRAPRQLDARDRRYPSLPQVARPFALDALIRRLALVGVRLGST